jgi:hypothetical protein
MPTKRPAAINNGDENLDSLPIQLTRTRMNFLDNGWFPSALNVDESFV